MLEKLKKRDEGFTIIEVLIVLAIAGLILLIVFLAVPALERASRNTQRKDDASAVASAVANFISNNGGSLPVAGGVKNDATNANEVDICGVAACASGNYETAKLGYYKADTAHVFIEASAAAAPTVGAPTSTPSATNITTESITIDTGYECNATNTGIGSPSTRSAAVFYVVEQGSGNGALQCVEQ
jgi:prepilin-type N-terminal cleavage/methylation domain-containing protein